MKPRTSVEARGTALFVLPVTDSAGFVISFLDDVGDYGDGDDVKVRERERSKKKVSAKYRIPLRHTISGMWCKPSRVLRDSWHYVHDDKYAGTSSSSLSEVLRDDWIRIYNSQDTLCGRSRVVLTRA